MKNLILLFLLSAFMFTACKQSSNIQKVEADGLFSIEMPTFMKKTTGLNDDASIEYEDVSNEYYMIVIVDNIESFEEAIQESDYFEYYVEGFVGYCDFIYESFSDKLDEYEDSQWIDLKINNMDAARKEVKRTMKDMDIFYSYNLVHGSKNYYQVLFWTLHEKKDAYKIHIDNMLNSFKEL